MKYLENAQDRKEITMSLSRWLKVDELLSNTIKELKKDISMTLVALKVTKFDVKHKAERLLKRKKESLKALETYMLVQETKIYMRTKIAERNVSNGINKSLAYISFLKKRSQFLGALIKAQLSKKETIENLCEAYKANDEEEIESFEKKVYENSGGYDYETENMMNMINGKSDRDSDLWRDINNSDGVGVGLLNHSEVDDLKREVAEIRIKVFDLKNTIAEKNTEKLTLEIPVEVAKFFTR